MIDSLTCNPSVRFVTATKLQTVHELAGGFAKFFNLSQLMSSTTIENYVYLVTDATKASSGECDKYDYECNNRVRSCRDQKKFAFIEVNDGSTLSGIQAVADEAIPTFSEVKRYEIVTTSNCIFSLHF